MSAPHAPADDRPEPGWYEIRLTGHLDARWAARFDGLSLSQESDGTTILAGPVVDQAALHGLLRKVRDLGLPLVSVIHVEPGQSDSPAGETRAALTNVRKEIDMTTAIRTTATQRASMDSMRKAALAAGALYLLSFVSIPTLFLYSAVHKATYIVGSGSDTPVIIGVILELIVALAGIGTAVALFPVLKREHEGVALGFVGSRVVEACTIFVGAASLLVVVALRRDGAGAEALVTGKALVAFYDIFFRIGQSFFPAVSALLLGSVLYRTRLVPRALPLLGLVGAPLLIAADVASLFGLFGHMGMFGLTSSLPGLAGMPIAVWEFSLGVWLVVKGFNAAAPISKAARSATEELVPAT